MDEFVSYNNIRLKLKENNIKRSGGHFKIIQYCIHIELCYIYISWNSIETI